MLCSENDWSSGFCQNRVLLLLLTEPSLRSRAILSCLCLQPAHEHNLNMIAFPSNMENTFCTVITRQMQWDRSTQAGALSGGWAGEPQGRRESGGRGEGGFPWARSPLQSPSQGSAGRKLGISLLSALEISDTGSCSCGSPEGVPVMKPEGGGLKRSFCGWCNLGQPWLGSDTSDLVTTCSVVTAPLLAWWSQEREEKKK